MKVIALKEFDGSINFEMKEIPIAYFCECALSVSDQTDRPTGAERGSDLDAKAQVQQIY